VTSARWDPDCYQTFSRERRQPFDDLRALVEPAPGMRIVDLGCGTGELTAELHRDLGAAETVGVERDEAMFARARGRDGLRFLHEDIDTFLRRPESRRAFDLVFSNAALHWIADHERLMSLLVTCLAPGGQLAFQVPANHDHIAHRLADEVARQPPFREALGGYQRGEPVLDVRRYAELLHDLGLRFPRAQLRVYVHELARRDDVLAWLRGSLLTAYEGRLDSELFEIFVDRLRQRLREALPDREPFVYTYKRLLVQGRLAVTP
jgi:trans-aconitate 2-methyltransferase